MNEQTDMYLHAIQATAETCDGKVEWKDFFPARGRLSDDDLMRQTFLVFGYLMIEKKYTKKGKIPFDIVKFKEILNKRNYHSESIMLELWDNFMAEVYHTQIDSIL